MAHLPTSSEIYDAYLENATNGEDDSLFFIHDSDRLQYDKHMRRIQSDPSRSPQARAITESRNAARRLKNAVN